MNSSTILLLLAFPRLLSRYFIQQHEDTALPCPPDSSTVRAPNGQRLEKLVVVVVRPVGALSTKEPRMELTQLLVKTVWVNTVGCQTARS